jgi:5-hydroxyisourate hydrolase-like protein (transthyretin family)
LTGRVIDTAKSQPILGATISIGEHVEAVAAADGRFAFDVDPDKWPDSLTLAASGFGTVLLAVPRARASTDLLDIALQAGASVDVSVERPNNVPVMVAMYRFVHGTAAEAPFAQRAIDARDAVAHFDSLAPGDYIVVASGPAETERIGMRLKLAAAEKKETALVAKPRRVTVRTKRGDEPLADVSVMISHEIGFWRSRLQTDGDGSVESTFWQVGGVVAVLGRETPPLTPYVERKDLQGDDAIEWTINLPAREIHGHVIDAATGKAIPNVFVAIIQEAREGPMLSVRASSDEDGRFRFDSAIAGVYKFVAHADGYAEKQIREIIREEEQTHEITVALQPKPTIGVTVRDSRGAPVAEALVILFAGLQKIGEQMTDSSGEVRVPLQDGEVRDIYVIPRDGSVASATLRKRDDIVVTVPPPQTTVIITCVDTGNKPIPNMVVVMRINGIPLPLEVMEALANYQGATLFSGADGRIVLRQMPSGVHEFWPLSSPAEVRAALLGLGRKAPVTIVAHAGINEATLTFEEKHP